MFDLREILYPILGTCLGTGLFFWGFRIFRKKKLIEDLPTSTIRGMAMGLVEVCGIAGREKILTAPLSGESCVMYQYLIERYQKSGKSRDWVTIARGNSFECDFILKDKTGSVAVLPMGAEIICSVRYFFETRFGSGLPDQLKSFMSQSGLSYQGLFGTHKLRFTERYIMADEQVYVLGTAQKAPQLHDRQKEYRARLMARINALKDDSVKMAEVDENRDGHISDEEWQRAVNRIEQELLEEELHVRVNEQWPEVVIARGQNEKTFVISDQSQNDLGWRLGWQAGFYIIGGMLMASVSLWYLVEHVKY